MAKTINTASGSEDLRPERSFEDPKDRYYNRELSWLLFNQRILDEARDRQNLLFERLKFLSITASNLDEFFMVRVASLKDMIHADYKGRDIAGMTAEEQFSAVQEKTHAMVEQQYSTYRRSLLRDLRSEGLSIVSEFSELTKDEFDFLDRYFEDNVYPVLTPMAFDSSRPFPLILNKSLNIAALLRRKDLKGDKKEGEKKEGSKKKQGSELEFAMVQVPKVLKRVVELPERISEKGEVQRVAILLEDLIEYNIDKLFSNYDVINSAPFRIMRNADFDLDEDEIDDLLEEISKQLKKRRRGDVIRLEISDRADKSLIKILKKELWIEDEDIYHIDGPLDLTFLMSVYSLSGFDRLKDRPYAPREIPELMNEDDIFTNIRKGDIFLHHPYESFDPVVRFVKEAAADEQVLAIKQTLYRVSSTSPIIAALETAAANGKQVTVLVELKARFDEENNILWAKRLEKAGCHVIYGLRGLKTHSKITLVVRREDDGIRRYVHLGTGNYNDSTAKLYTDCGIMTIDPMIGEDATAVFNMLSGYSEPAHWNELILAPIWLRKWLIKRIKRETDFALSGREASITAKMNSLCDKEVIDALYEASKAGVRIELIVRGICCLRAGVPGLSDNISVHSIVGRYLEHARIMRFENGGDPLYFMGSADWMPRNLDRRVEIVFPLLTEESRRKADHILSVQLSDNLKAHILMPDGSYEKADLRGKRKLCAQEIFMAEAAEREKDFKKEKSSAGKRTFTPMEAEG
ncbi:MAG TPA: RNA degradosome polyphosphate kinase [Candidatus Avilachnospira avistercoris]|nr:RNA degradosome polyphosphate kinase [Candidatus Avilachnospira avistercoris]